MKKAINKIKCLLNGHNFVASGERKITGQNEIGTFYTENFSCICGKTIECRQIDATEQGARTLVDRMYSAVAG